MGEITELTGQITELQHIAGVLALYEESYQPSAISLQLSGCTFWLIADR
jgi:hypothetical protein